MERENFVTVSGWMIKDLKLKGAELMCYAVIFGFTQDGESWFKGSLAYLAEWSCATRQGAFKALGRLEGAGLIRRHEVFENGQKFVNYRCNLEFTPLNKVVRGVKQSLTGCTTEFNGGVKQSLTHNIKHNIDINIDKEIEGGTPAPAEEAPTRKKAKSAFVPPTLDEIKTFFQEHKITVDAEYFFNYYEARGWSFNSGAKVRSWQATARQWQARERQFSMNGKKGRHAMAEDEVKPGQYEAPAQLTEAEIERLNKGDVPI